MFKTRFLRLAALGILAGCTAQPAKNHSTDTVNAGRTVAQCHAEQTTGSLIVHTVCTTKAEQDAQRGDVNDVRDATVRQAGGCNPGSPHCPQ